MSHHNDAPGMKGYRSRNERGPLRGKRGDTHIGTIEKAYNLDLKVRSDMRLDTYLKREGSISEKRDLLGNLRSRLVYRDKKVALME